MKCPKPLRNYLLKKKSGEVANGTKVRSVRDNGEYESEDNDERVLLEHNSASSVENGSEICSTSVEAIDISVLEENLIGENSEKDGIFHHVICQGRTSSEKAEEEDRLSQTLASEPPQFINKDNTGSNE